MDTRFDSALQSWLAAEREDRDAAADRALVEVFLALPLLSPAAGFADRVVAGARRGGIQLRPVWTDSRWARGAIAACLLLAGLASTYAVPLVFGLLQLLAPGEAVGGLVRAFVDIAGHLDEVLSVGLLLARVAQTSLLVATAPPVVLVLLALTVLSAFTFRGLSELLAPSRSSGYAHANHV